MKATLEINEKYINEPGNCPKCNNGSIEYDNVEIFAANQILQNINCMTCDFEWQDVYEFKGYYPLKIENEIIIETKIILNDLRTEIGNILIPIISYQVIQHILNTLEKILCKHLQEQNT